MTPYFHYLWKYGQTRGLWMQPVLAILGRWSIRLSTFRLAIRCFTMVLFMVPIISGSSWPLYMPSPSVGNKDFTPKPSIPTAITPSSGLASGNARPSWSARPRRNRFSKSLPEQSIGFRLMTTVIPLLNGKPRNGVKSQLILGGNKKKDLSL